MMTMAGGDGEGEGKGGRQTSSKVIFDNFWRDLDYPGVQDNLSFYSKRSSFQAIQTFRFCHLRLHSLYYLKKYKCTRIHYRAVKADQDSGSGPLHFLNFFFCERAISAFHKALMKFSLRSDLVLQLRDTFPDAPTKPQAALKLSAVQGGTCGHTTTQTLDSTQDRGVYSARQWVVWR